MSLVTDTIRAQQAEEILDYYSTPGNEWKFVPDILGGVPWTKQIEIIQAVFKYKTVAVKTCNAVGKSYIAARIVVTFLLLHPGSIVVTTAPTWRQVKDVLWREIATTVKKSAVKLTKKEVNQVGLNLDTDWYAVGLSTKYPENFFGYHSDHILVVVDEAGGVPEQIFTGVKAITPNANAHVLLIGNPTNPDGTFYRAFKDPLIKSFTISAFDTPNLRANGIHNVDDLLKMFTPPPGVDKLEFFTQVRNNLKLPYPALIDPAVVYERYHEWGTDSPAWQALIMGEFPSQSTQSLIPIELVQMAMGMTEIDADSGKTYAELSGWQIPDGPDEYGLDMARYGNDNTVLFPRHGGWVGQAVSWGKTSLMDSADRVLKLIDPLDFNVRLNIDDTGNGGGTTDRLRQISAEQKTSGSPMHQYNLAAYNFSSKEFMQQPGKFHDITSELYWNLRSWFMKKQIAIPYNERLFNELVGRRWFINKSGKIQVESKDEYKKRTGGKSPDFSDSLALAFAGGIRQIKTRVPEEHQRGDNDEYEESAAVVAPITSGLSRRGW